MRVRLFHLSVFTLGVGLLVAGVVPVVIALANENCIIDANIRRPGVELEVQHFREIASAFEYKLFAFVGSVFIIGSFLEIVRFNLRRKNRG